MSNGTSSFLTFVFASLFLVSLGIIHSASAMGPGPGCTFPSPEYDGTIIFAKINNGTQTFNAGPAFEATTKPHSYNVWYIIKMPDVSSDGGGVQWGPGGTWYSIQYPTFSEGNCIYSGIYPNENLTGTTWVGSYDGQPQSDGVCTTKNCIGWTVNWVGYSNATVYNTVPNTPTNLSAWGWSSSQIFIGWNQPLNSTVTGYKIERSPDGGSNWSTIAANTNSNATTYEDSNLAPHATYYYRVSAINSFGTSPPSAAASATTFYPVLTVTSQYTNGTAVNVNFILSQNRSSVGMVGMGATSTPFFLTNGGVYDLYAVDPYHLVLDHWNDTGSNNYTRQISISKNTTITAIVRTVSYPPSGLAATGGYGYTSLAWTPPPYAGYQGPNYGGFFITNYKIYRSTSSGTETLLAETGNVNSYTDNNVTNGQTYYYKVTAINWAGESVQSNEASATPSASGDKVTATIPVGTFPDGVGVNPIRNMVYVTNHNDNTTSVIDGSTNTIVRTIPVGYSLVTVNPITDRIYVDAGNSGIAVIDGGTYSVIGTIPVPVGNGAVNTNTNRIYEAGCCGHDVISVIDGSNNTVTGTISAGTELSGKVSVNPNTNKIYATTICRGCSQNTSVMVIDGNTNSVVGNIIIPNVWQSLDVNPNTNTVYAAAGGNIYVINGSTNQITTTISGVITGMPSITVNPNTNKIYVSDLRNGVVSVIDGSTNNVENKISGFNQPYVIQVNPNTNMIYVANSGNNTVSVIQGRSSSTTAPSAPQNLTATVSTPSQVNLSWAPPSNNGGSAITGYMIERSTDGGTNWSTITSNTDTGGTTFSDTGLSPSTTYAYRVAAINSAGSSPPSNVVSATTPKMSLYPFWQTCCLGDLSVNGNVQNPIPGITQMRLLIHAPNGSLVFNQTESVGGFQSNYVISRSDGKGDYTITGTYNGMSQQKQIASMFDDPHPFVSVCECNSGIISYRGYVEGGLPGEKISTILKNSTNSTVASITQATDNHAQFMGGFGPFPKPENYTIIVTFLYNNSTAKATLAYTCQTPGCETSATIPNPPSNLSATTASSSQINLSWTAPTSNGGSPVTGYMIQRSTDSGTTWSTIISNSGRTSTSYSDTGLAASTTYTYQVSAINSVGTSPPSNTASATTSGITIASGIILNNVQSTSGTTSSSNQMTLSGFNAGTGSNKLLLVGISANNNSPVSVTFNGVQLTQAVGSFSNNDAEFWYLKNPTGTGDVVVTMNGPTQAVVGAYSFSGVNQTMPIPTHTVRHNINPNSPTMSITTKYPNDLVLDLPSIYGGSTLGSPTCTQQWDANVPNAITGASSSTTVPSPATIECKWAASSADFWDDVAVEVKAN